jgi:hypothetical protein
VSRADSRVRAPGTFPRTRCPAVTSALDAAAEAYDNPAAVWWGAFAGFRGHPRPGHRRRVRSSPGGPSGDARPAGRVDHRASGAWPLRSKPDERLSPYFVRFPGTGKAMSPRTRDGPEARRPGRGSPRWPARTAGNQVRAPGPGRQAPRCAPTQGRTISLGIGQIAADDAPEQPTSQTPSSRG